MPLRAASDDRRPVEEAIDSNCSYRDNHGCRVAGWCEQTPADRHLKQAKAATARFNSVAQALKTGYVRPVGPVSATCVSSPAGGLHFENPALMADPALDMRKPEILVYAPKRNGGLKLVAVEYFVASGQVTAAPTLFGHTFQGPMPGHHPGMPAHYDLHVWLFEPNPSGMFAQFNPNVHCPTP